MIINKIHTTHSQEESSSLINQKLFLRRPDLTIDIRLELAIAGLGPSYREGTIAELERKYKVSYTFIYTQANILKQNLSKLFGSKLATQADKLKGLLSVLRFYLQAKLETKGSLEGLSNLGMGLGLPYTSINFISELLSVAGALVGSTYQSEEKVELVFLCDEVYAAGQAILVTLDAQSMLVLDIKLVDGSLLGTDWEERFILLKANQVLAGTLIKDGGKQLQSASRVLSADTIIGADTFHAIAHRLGIYHARLVKGVRIAKEREDNRAERFASTKTYETALKKETEWELAKLKTLQAQDQLEWFEYYYFKMLYQLRPFTSQGLVRDKQKASQIIQESLQALSLLELPKLQKHLDHIAQLIQDGTLLHYLDQVPILYQQLQSQLDEQTTWLWMLYWQWNKKAQQTHCPKVNKRAKQEAQAAKELLQEYYQTHARWNKSPNPFEQLRVTVFTTLEQIVQASSLVETFNSILKPFINNARGQVSQELLNLVKFKHNYSRFRRGKRKGKAPIELFTGQNLEKHWIDLLMDLVEKAFVKHGVSSVKQLHQLIQLDQKQSIDSMKKLVVEKTDSIAA